LVPCESSFTADYVFCIKGISITNLAIDLMTEHREQRALTGMRAMIEAGDYPLNSRLPPERTLCERMGVTRAALRKALATLEAEGHIWRIWPRSPAGPTRRR
jgi:DNA-binding GntR family transcriptional regulator